MRPMRSRRGNIRGFTFVESMIVVSIISIMTALSVQAFPIARANQQLIADAELIRSLMLDAKERALNQVRPDNCLPIFNYDSDRASCSDVGIAFVGSREVVEFANTAGAIDDGIENDQGDHTFTDLNNSKDIVITRRTLNSTVSEVGHSFLLYSKPPSTIMYHYSPGNGYSVLGSGSSQTITLTNGGLSRTLTVHPYGIIDIQ